MQCFSCGATLEALSEGDFTCQRCGAVQEGFLLLEASEEDSNVRRLIASDRMTSSSNLISRLTELGSQTTSDVVSTTKKHKEKASRTKRFQNVHTNASSIISLVDLQNELQVMLSVISRHLKYSDDFVIFASKIWFLFLSSCADEEEAFSIQQSYIGNSLSQISFSDTVFPAEKGSFPWNILPLRRYRMPWDIYQFVSSSGELYKYIAYPTPTGSVIRRLCSDRYCDVPSRLGRCDKHITIAEVPYPPNAIIGQVWNLKSGLQRKWSTEYFEKLSYPIIKVDTKYDSKTAYESISTTIKQGYENNVHPLKVLYLISEKSYEYLENNQNNPTVDNSEKASNLEGLNEYVFSQYNLDKYIPELIQLLQTYIGLDIENKNTIDIGNMLTTICSHIYNSTIDSPSFKLEREAMDFLKSLSFTEDLKSSIKLYPYFITAIKAYIPEFPFLYFNDSEICERFCSYDLITLREIELLTVLVLIWNKLLEPIINSNTIYQNINDLNTNCDGINLPFFNSIIKSIELESYDIEKSKGINKNSNIESIKFKEILGQKLKFTILSLSLVYDTLKIIDRISILVKEKPEIAYRSSLSVLLNVGSINEENNQSSLEDEINYDLVKNNCIKRNTKREILSFANAGDSYYRDLNKCDKYSLSNLKSKLYRKDNLMVKRDIKNSSLFQINYLHFSDTYKKPKNIVYTSINKIIRKDKMINFHKNLKSTRYFKCLKNKVSFKQINLKSDNKTNYFTFASSMTLKNRFYNKGKKSFLSKENSYNIAISLSMLCYKYILSQMKDFNKHRIFDHSIIFNTSDGRKQRKKEVIYKNGRREKSSQTQAKECMSFVSRFCNISGLQKAKYSELLYKYLSSLITQPLQIGYERTQLFSRVFQLKHSVTPRESLRIFREYHQTAYLNIVKCRQLLKWEIYQTNNKFVQAILTSKDHLVEDNINNLITNPNDDSNFGNTSLEKRGLLALPLPGMVLKDSLFYEKYKDWIIVSHDIVVSHLRQVVKRHPEGLQLEDYNSNSISISTISLENALEIPLNIVKQILSNKRLSNSNCIDLGCNMSKPSIPNNSEAIYLLNFIDHAMKNGLHCMTSPDACGYDDHEKLSRTGLFLFLGYLLDIIDYPYWIMHVRSERPLGVSTLLGLIVAALTLWGIPVFSMDAIGWLENKILSGNTPNISPESIAQWASTIVSSISQEKLFNLSTHSLNNIQDKPKLTTSTNKTDFSDGQYYTNIQSNKNIMPEEKISHEVELLHGSFESDLIKSSINFANDDVSEKTENGYLKSENNTFRKIDIYNPMDNEISLYTKKNEKDININQKLNQYTNSNRYYSLDEDKSSMNIYSNPLNINNKYSRLPASRYISRYLNVLGIREDKLFISALTDLVNLVELKAGLGGLRSKACLLAHTSPPSGSPVYGETVLGENWAVLIAAVICISVKISAIGSHLEREKSNSQLVSSIWSVTGLSENAKLSLCKGPKQVGFIEKLESSQSNKITTSCDKNIFHNFHLNCSKKKFNGAFCKNNKDLNYQLSKEQEKIYKHKRVGDNSKKCNKNNENSLIDIAFSKFNFASFSFKTTNENINRQDAFKLKSVNNQAKEFRNMKLFKKNFFYPKYERTKNTDSSEDRLNTESRTSKSSEVSFEFLDLVKNFLLVIPRNTPKNTINLSNKSFSINNKSTNKTKFSFLNKWTTIKRYFFKDLVFIPYLRIPKIFKKMNLTYYFRSLCSWGFYKPNQSIRPDSQLDPYTNSELSKRINSKLFFADNKKLKRTIARKKFRKSKIYNHVKDYSSVRIRKLVNSVCYKNSPRVSKFSDLFPEIAKRVEFKAIRRIDYNEDSYWLKSSPEQSNVPIYYSQPKLNISPNEKPEPTNSDMNSTCVVSDFHKNYKGLNSSITEPYNKLNYSDKNKNTLTQLTQSLNLYNREVILSPYVQTLQSSSKVRIRKSKFVYPIYKGSYRKKIVERNIQRLKKSVSQSLLKAIMLNSNKNLNRQENLIRFNNYKNKKSHRCETSFVSRRFLCHDALNGFSYLPNKFKYSLQDGVRVFEYDSIRYNKPNIKYPSTDSETVDLNQTVILSTKRLDPSTLSNIGLQQRKSISLHDYDYSNYNLKKESSESSNEVLKQLVSFNRISNESDDNNITIVGWGEKRVSPNINTEEEDYVRNVAHSELALWSDSFLFDSEDSSSKPSTLSSSVKQNSEDLSTSDSTISVPLCKKLHVEAESSDNIPTDNIFLSTVINSDNDQNVVNKDESSKFKFAMSSNNYNTRIRQYVFSYIYSKRTDKTSKNSVNYNIKSVSNRLHKKSIRKNMFRSHVITKKLKTYDTLEYYLFDLKNLKYNIEKELPKKSSLPLNYYGLKNIGPNNMDKEINFFNFRVEVKKINHFDKNIKKNLIFADKDQNTDVLEGDMYSSILESIAELEAICKEANEIDEIRHYNSSDENLSNLDKLPDLEIGQDSNIQNIIKDNDFKYENIINLEDKNKLGFYQEFSVDSSSDESSCNDNIEAVTNLTNNLISKTRKFVIDKRLLKGVYLKAAKGVNKKIAHVDNIALGNISSIELPGDFDGYDSLKQTRVGLGTVPAPHRMSQCRRAIAEFVKRRPIGYYLHTTFITRVTKLIEAERVAKNFTDFANITPLIKISTSSENSVSANNEYNYWDRMDSVLSLLRRMPMSPVLTAVATELFDFMTIFPNYIKQYKWKDFIAEENLTILQVIPYIALGESLEDLSSHFLWHITSPCIASSKYKKRFMYHFEKKKVKLVKTFDKPNLDIIKVRNHITKAAFQVVQTVHRVLQLRAATSCTKIGILRISDVYIEDNLDETFLFYEWDKNKPVAYNLTNNPFHFSFPHKFSTHRHPLLLISRDHEIGNCAVFTEILITFIKSNKLRAEGCSEEANKFLTAIINFSPRDVTGSLSQYTIQKLNILEKLVKNTITTKDSEIHDCDEYGSYNYSSNFIGVSQDVNIANSPELTFANIGNYKKSLVDLKLYSLKNNVNIYSLRNNLANKTFRINKLNNRFTRRITSKYFYSMNMFYGRHKDKQLFKHKYFNASKRCLTACISADLCGQYNFKHHNILFLSKINKKSLIFANTSLHDSFRDNKPELCEKIFPCSSLSSDSIHIIYLVRELAVKAFLSMNVEESLSHIINIFLNCISITSPGYTRGEFHHMISLQQVMRKERCKYCHIPHEPISKPRELNNKLFLNWLNIIQKKTVPMKQGIKSDLNDASDQYQRGTEKTATGIQLLPNYNIVGKDLEIWNMIKADQNDSSGLFNDVVVKDYEQDFHDWAELFEAESKQDDISSNKDIFSLSVDKSNIELKDNQNLDQSTSIFANNYEQSISNFDNIVNFNDSNSDKEDISNSIFYKNHLSIDSTSFIRRFFLASNSDTSIYRPFTLACYQSQNFLSSIPLEEMPPNMACTVTLKSLHTLMPDINLSSFLSAISLVEDILIITNNGRQARSVLLPSLVDMNFDKSLQELLNWM